MADNGFEATKGPERSELIPASMVQKPALSPVMLPTGPSRPATSRGLDPILLLKSFRRRWPLALGTGLAMAVVVGLAAWLLIPPPLYTSRSMLRVSMFPPSIIFRTNEQLSDFRTFQKTQTEMIKSRIVLGPALRDPRVANLPIVKEQADPQEWLEKEIIVDFPSGSELLMISMSSQNPDELKPIVDSVVTAYMETVVEEEHKVRVLRLESLRKLWNRYQDELKEKRRTLRQLSNVVGTEDRSTMVLKQTFSLENLHSLERELYQIQGELRRFNAYNDIIEKKKGESGDSTEIVTPTSDLASDTASSLMTDTAIEAKLDADPQIQNLRSQHDSTYVNYLRLKKLARKVDDPATNAARARYTQARDALAKHKDRLRDSYATATNSSVPGTPGALPTRNPESFQAIFREKLAILKKNEAELIKELEKARQEASKLNGQTIDLQTEQDEIAVADSTAKDIGRQVEILDVELQAPRRIALLTPAEPPRKKDSTKQYMLCGGASFGAFALAILAISFWEMRAMRIGSVDEVVTELGLALVGALPALPSRGGKLAKAEDQRWQGLLVESIDATRTMLLHASRVNATRAVMITSAMKGEGKTSLAAHLATSLARAGRKTLLVDCDLRRPTLHQLFDVARVPGLCELLRGEAEVNDAIRPTPADDLNLMPAGHCDGLSLQAIAQDGFRDVLTILKKRYDFIIIDSAPVLPVVDTMLLSQQVDAVLFSIMREVSRVPHVQAAHERLASLGVRMLGAVVNAAERRDYMHAYDYDYQTAESV